MNNNQIVILQFVVIALLCFVNEGFAIKCWRCSSDTDPKCSDPFDNSTVPIVDCSKEKELDHLPGAKATMCRKIRQKIYGQWRYYRNCAYMGEPGIEGDERFCLMRTGTYNIFMEYCTCNSKDGCNTASGMHYSKLLQFLGIFTTLFFHALVITIIYGCSGKVIALTERVKILCLIRIIMIF